MMILGEKMAKTNAYTESELETVKAILTEGQVVPQTIGANTLNDCASVVLSILGLPPCSAYQSSNCHSYVNKADCIKKDPMDKYVFNAIGLLGWHKDMSSMQGI